jgi:hypothetical protein
LLPLLLAGDLKPEVSMRDGTVVTLDHRIYEFIVSNDCLEAAACSNLLFVFFALTVLLVQNVLVKVDPTCEIGVVCKITDFGEQREGGVCE